MALASVTRCGEVEALGLSLAAGEPAQPLFVFGVECFQFGQQRFRAGAVLTRRPDMLDERALALNRAGCFRHATQGFLCRCFRHRR